MDFSKVIEFAKEAFRPTVAFCFGTICLVFFLLRDHSEFGVVYKEWKPWILFIGSFAALLWIVYVVVTAWQKKCAADAAAARKRTLNDLLDRLNPGELAIIVPLLRKDHDTNSYISTQHWAAIGSLEAKGLITAFRPKDSGRTNVTITPEAWCLLQERKDFFVAKLPTNVANSDQPKESE